MQNGNGSAAPGKPAAVPRQTSVAEAARLLGIAERDGHGWRVCLPPDVPGAPASVAAEPGNGAATIGSDAAAPGNIAAELAVAHARLAATEAERDHLRGQLAARTEAEAELRRL